MGNLLDLTTVLLVTAAGLATGIGAAVILFVKKITHRLHDSLIGFSAGLMLAVTALILLPTALGPNQENLIQTITGISVGVVILFIVEAKITHLHRIFGLEKSRSVKTSLMIALAILIHNLPEGFATGSAYSQGVTPLGNTVALAIALQNIPEGLIVAFPLVAVGVSVKRSFGFGVLSGAVEPV
ncbi:MAG: ZIP family metal transporter, partial [Candidatus Bathyarchaeia archaeon]